MTTAFAFDVGRYGAFLATRSTARTVRRDLESNATSLDRNYVVVIDFARVDAMTISFADEFLGKFYTTVSAGDISAQGILLRGLNDETLEAVTVCLERRDLVAAVTTSNTIHLVAAPEFLNETYRQARVLGTFRATDLSELLGITPQNVNNRLKRLASAGILRRERRNISSRGGKEFVYSVPNFAV